MSGTIADGYNASFDGVSFMELFDSGYAVEPESGVDYAVAPVVNVVQTSGQSSRTLDLPIALAAAQLTSLRTKANSATRASLVYHAGTVNARLLKIKGVRKQLVQDIYLATLEMVVG